VRFLVILACVTCFPTAVLAQAAIAGIVTDESGGAMQGVVVEASSPSLIDRIRTAVTDGTGRYRIERLPPGFYRVRFTLPGWTPYQQENVELRRRWRLAPRA
jgi:Carboxypeptidase regulatory-like domain